MKTKLQSVLNYFERFSYNPTFEEVHTFFPVKIGQNKLKDCIDRTHKHTLGGYGIVSKVEGRKSKVSLTKIAGVTRYLDFISRFPQIRLIGLSGSVAMLNAQKTDDVDLFIISTKNRLWTARFVTVIAAWLFGIKRSKQSENASNKICLNLFFSEASLKINKNLHTEYMAHEVLQMVPIMDVNKTYRRFLVQNDWIRVYCPNVDPKSYFPYHFSPERYVVQKRKNKDGVTGNIVEAFLKHIQLWYMRKPIGDERIEEGQLWFHPRDYGRIVGK